MIVLDADVLIGLLDDQDAHYDAARALLVTEESLGAATMTLAEALVVPARARREDEGARRLASLGIEEIPLPSGSSPALARVRAASGLRMPDCVSLHTARERGALLATFDDRLRRAAMALGVETLP